MACRAAVVLTPPELKSAIVREPLITAPDTSVMSAIALMDDSRDWGASPSMIDAEVELDELHQSVRSSCVFVVDTGCVVGIFTERDVVRLVRQHQSLDHLLMKQVMQSVASPVRESALGDALAAVNQLQQQAAQHLPVLDEQDNLIGVITPASLAGPLTGIGDCHAAVAELSLKKTLLAQIANNAPCSEVLSILTDAMEQTLPGALCSVLLVDEHHRLRNGASPSLPLGYIQAIEGAPVREGVGSCGTAASRRETVIVTDIATDPLWQDYKHIALAYDLKACWSTPIITQHERVVGTFAVYYPAVRSPQLHDLEIIARMADIAGVAVQHYQTQGALQKSETRWQFALEGAGAGVWDWNAYGEPIFFSPQWKAMLGYDEHEIGDYQEEWESRIHPDDRARVYEAIERHSRGETALYENEHRLRCKDGRYKWVLSRGKAIERAANGDPVRILGIHTDISDRKQAEIALRESEARWQFALEGAGAGVWDWNPETGVVFFSPQWKAMLGYDEHEISTRIEEWQSRIHPDDKARVMAATESHFRGVTPTYISEYRLLCKDGRYKWIASRGKVIERTATGEPLRIIGFHTDISDRKRAEAALIESEQRFRSLFESTPKIAVQGYNCHRQVIYWNEASEQLYGYTREEVMGQRLEDLIIPPEMQPDMIKAVRAWSEEGQPIPASELNLLHKDGSRVTVFSSHIMVTNAHDEPEMYCVDIDLSAAKKAEAQLQMLVAGTATTTGDEFFPALARCIAKALDVTHVIVAEKVGNQLHTLAFWGDGTLQPVFSYALVSTPCERVLEDGLFYCANAVQQAFPDDLDLVAMGIESYLGVVLQNAQGQAIGHLCILHQHPIQNSHQAEQILRVFAARAAAELERQRALVALEQLNQSLEARVTQRTAELQEREKFLQTVLDSFPLSVFWKDRDSVYLGGNRQFLQSAGLSSSADLLGKTDYDMPWRDTEAEAYRADDRVVMAADVGLLGIVETQTQADGCQIWAETNKVPLHSLDGEVIGVLGTYQDISDRKQAELDRQQLTQELAEWRDRYEIAAQASGQVLFEYDLATDQDTWGPNFETVLGHRLDVFPEGMQVYLSQIHPEDQAAYQCIIDNDRTIKGPYQTEYRFRAADGTYRWIEERGMTRYDAQGEPVQVIGYLQNVSDRKQAEFKLQQLTQELAEWRDRYDIAARASGQVLFEYTIATDQDTWGPNLEAVLGCTAAAMPPSIEACISRVHPEDQDTFRQVVLHDRIANEPYQIEFRFRNPDGTYRWIEERGMTLRNNRCEAVQVIGYWRDISDRKQTEAALIQSEAKSRAILAAIPDLILRVDRDGIYRELVVNSPDIEAFFRGRDPVGISMKETLPAELLPQKLQAITQALQTGQLQVYEQQVKIGDRLRHEEIRVVKGGADEVILMIRDISDRKRAELALRNKTEELDRFFSLALDLLCIANVEGYFIRLNSQWEKTLGYPLSDLEGTQFLNYVHPDDFEGTLQTFQQTRAGEETLNFVNRYRCRDGSYRWIEWRSVTHGHLIYAAARDITERKQAEAELRASRAYYQGIVADQTDLICRFLPDGTLTFVNEAYCDFFQRSRQSLVGSSFLGLMPETDAVIALHRLNSLSQEEPVSTYEHQVFAPDGTLRWQQWTDRALFNDEGNLVKFQSVGHDITALKTAEAALLDSEQRFRRAIEDAPFPIIIYAEDGEVLQLNTAWSDLSGYTHRDIPTMHAWAERAYGEQAPDVLENVVTQKYILKSRWDEGEFTITTRNGTQLIWHFSSAPLGCLPDGRRAVISMAADMTRYRQAETALRESEARWQFALEGAGHGVWDWNIQSNSIFFSPQLKAMLGYAETEIESSVEAWNDWIHPEDKALVECEVSRYLSGATSTYQNEHRLRCKDGSYKWILDRATVIKYTAHGEPWRMIGTHTDITERKQRELESRLLASVVESSEDAIITQDLNGTITSWNTGAVNLFSRSQEEAIGQSITLLVPLDWPSDMFDIFENLEQEQSIKHFEMVCCRNSPMQIDVAVTVAPLRAKDGKLTGTSIIVRDITERKQIEAERLRAEETRKAFELLERVVDNVLAGYWDWDIPNGVEYLSPGFKRMFGYTDHELANTPRIWQDLIFPEDLDIVQTCFDRHVKSRGQTPYYNEVRYRHKNGSTVWVMCSGQVIEWDETGAPRRMIGCHIDISDRKLAEAYVRQESTFRQKIVEHMTEGLCVCHEIETFPFLHFTVWNPQMHTITGYTQEEINRLGWYQSLFPNAVSQQQAITRMERMQRGETLTDEEWYIQRQDGEQRAIAISTSVLPSDAGEIYILALMQDITVRKRADAQLRQTNEELARATRLKDEFLANMSHELRTPLNAILGITEGLQVKAFGELSSDQLDALGTIERSGSYLLDLINDILDVAKIEAGQIQLNKTWVSVASLCQSSVAFVKQPAWKKDIQIDLRLPHFPLNVYVDERRMRQVLLNLLDNAVKFTPTGGKITLQAMGRPSYWEEPHTVGSMAPDVLRLTVSDTGIGIARDRIDSLFEPFVQIDSALSRQNTGTGLGLALVERIVKLHGGEVTITSELDVGSCFTIDLPCQISTVVSTATVFQAEQGTTYAPPAAASPLILLAEDNEANIKTTSRYLIAKGYRVAIARTGKEAVTAAQSEQPDLILMDIQMPQMDGLEAIQQIRQDPQLLSTPIIALTALAMSGDRDRCLAAGADDYLSKPVRLHKLVTTIQQFLSHNNDT